MTRKLAKQAVSAGLLCTAATFSAVAAPPPAAAYGVAAAPHAPQFVLYISRSLGGGSGGGSLLGRPAFGVRLEQVHLRPNLADPGMDPMQHHELVNWQMQTHADVQLEFGHRITWNLSRAAIGPRANTTYSIAFGPQARLPAGEVAAPPRSFAARGGDTNHAAADSYREFSAGEGFGALTASVRKLQNGGIGGLFKPGIEPRGGAPGFSNPAPHAKGRGGITALASQIVSGPLRGSSR